jgi:hypothetical protein
MLFIVSPVKPLPVISLYTGTSSGQEIVRGGEKQTAGDSGMHETS